jgi:quercetin dioxygenase-like cupin family protein
MAVATLHTWGEIPLDKVTDMVARKTVEVPSIALSQVYVKKGSLVPYHRHDGEQLVYVLQGALRVTIGPDDVTVREGEMLHVPAGLGHQAEALDDTFVIDIRSRGRP